MTYYYELIPCVRPHNTSTLIFGSGYGGQHLAKTTLRFVGKPLKVIDMPRGREHEASAITIETKRTLLRVGAQLSYGSGAVCEEMVAMMAD